MAKLTHRPIEGIEITDDQEIEVIGERDLRKLLEDESFMNEPVTILLHSTTDENAPPHVTVGVNGINMPILRGTPTIVKRKFVEVLARCKETRYRQPTRDMANPEAGNGLLGSTANAYPFDMLEDKNPKGRAWLMQIMAEPA
jgi:hypothetical protein